MDKGYIENGFIIDLTNTKRTSDIIYELSRILDMPDSKGKYICLKLGSIDLSQAELTSIKALVELMESKLEFISTSSTTTLESATAADIKISEFTTAVEAPVFEESEPTEEVAKALDNIFENSSSNMTTEIQSQEIVEVVNHEDAPIIEPEETDLESETESLPTLYLRKTIRSGQSISSDGNIIVIGDVNPGAEIIAKGDITVWGILGGIAHAGSDGNNLARIRALKLNPVQIRIGEIFARRPDTVNLPYIQKTCEYIPEEAFAYKGNIVIKKLHEEN